jgi:hypothetical protein
MHTALCDCSFITILLLAQRELRIEARVRSGVRHQTDVHAILTVNFGSQRTMISNTDERNYWARDCIDISEQIEVEYWAYKWDVPIARLIHAQRDVGPLIKDIAIELGRAVGKKPHASIRNIRKTEIKVAQHTRMPNVVLSWLESRDVSTYILSMRKNK